MTKAENCRENFDVTELPARHALQDILWPALSSLRAGPSRDAAVDDYFTSF